MYHAQRAHVSSYFIALIQEDYATDTLPLTYPVVYIEININIFYLILILIYPFFQMFS